MSSLVERLHLRNLITPPHYVLSGMQYETIMGSIAYGVADTTEKGTSDVDVYGFCIPFKDMIFPHIAGNVVGFGRQIKRFDQYQQHNVTNRYEIQDYMKKNNIDSKITINEIEKELIRRGLKK